MIHEAVDRVEEPVEVQARRIEDVTSHPVVDPTTLVFQPNRLDVLVHLRALEELAGVHPGNRDDGIDWVGASDALAVDDVEPTVGELAAELLASDRLDHPVVFGAGGRLVTGASVAAACLYGAIPVQRKDSGMKAVDRSQHHLIERGFTTAELRGAVDTWLRRDPRATLLLVDHDARCADAALAEIERRYEVFYAEFEHLSAGDAHALGVGTAGSMHALAVRVDPRTVGPVLARHGDAIAGFFTGRAAMGATRVLYDDGRVSSTSPSHARALRTRRRLARRARMVAGLRALVS